jgi:hypothetical protein
MMKWSSSQNILMAQRRAVLINGLQQPEICRLSIRVAIREAACVTKGAHLRVSHGIIDGELIRVQDLVNSLEFISFDLRVKKDGRILQEQLGLWVGFLGLIIWIHY